MRKRFGCGIMAVVICVVWGPLGCGNRMRRATPQPEVSPRMDLLSKQLPPMTARNDIDWEDWVATCMVAMDQDLSGGQISVADIMGLILSPKTPTPQRYSLLMGGSEFLLPDHERGPQKISPPKFGEKMIAWSQMIRERQLAAANSFVELACRDPKGIEPYFEFVLWSEILFLSVPDSYAIDFDRVRGQASYLLKEIKAAEEDPQFQSWFLRDSILMAHLMDRDDLFAGVMDRKTLLANVLPWLSMMADWQNVRITLPKRREIMTKPFSDWMGNSPAVTGMIGSIRVTNVIYRAHFRPWLIKKSPTTLP